MQQTRTRRQREVLDFIIRYIEGHGYEPSYQMIARHLGVRSKAGIAKHIEALEEQGLLRRRSEDGTFKLEICQKQNIAEQEFDVEWLRSAADDDELEEWELSPLAVPRFMLGEIDPSEVFAYRMPDNAMAGRNICSGDVILVERRTYFRDGTCVAATISNGPVILRNFYRNGSKIELHAANDAYETFRLEGDEVKIHGIFRGLIRPAF